MIPSLSFSQKISGIVTDIEGEPISNVQVLDVSLNRHTHTDETGRFVLYGARLHDTLEISHWNFEPQIRIIDSIPSFIRIAMVRQSVSLSEVVIEPGVQVLNVISQVDNRVRPVNSSQDILRQVPGLFIGQHAGGGKAEQIFMRGFDMDHGTDIAISVDDMPVNMVSHAHGQGYADLHFLIPETVDNINFGKGPYYPDEGNFNTGGYVRFTTKEKLDENLVKAEAGSFQTIRLLNMFRIFDRNGHHSYAAAEFLRTDGPFESPQNLNRINLFAKYSGRISSRDRFGLTLSHLSSQWSASGQIPQRAIDRGLITRWGAIDDTEGGTTQRTNVLFAHEHIINDHTSLTNKIYFTRYLFDLWSNFTFYLEDSINGDQIRQNEDRTLAGFRSTLNHTVVSGPLSGTFRAGIGLRNDRVNGLGLSHTLNRVITLETRQLGDVSETNYFAWASYEFKKGNLTVNPFLRYDLLFFQYDDYAKADWKSQSVSKGIVSGGLNLVYQTGTRTQFYLKSGRGFHSNDSRVSTFEQGRDVLPAAWGSDLGIIWKPFNNWLINAALWGLWLDQEFVYAGDAGTVEPSGKTFRRGLDLSMRVQTSKVLFWNLDVNYAYGRYTEEPDSIAYIPLAPPLTAEAGVNLILPSGWYAGLHLRHMSDRPANESGSITAKGYTVADAGAGYQWKRFDLGVELFNLTNTEWNETQFATLSRLKDEPQPVEEIHFIPGAPFTIKIKASFRF
ncbi:MAG: TonB-dependent receptor [Bacteroidales bacterium]